MVTARSSGLVFFFWIIWLWLLIAVFSDLFRSNDLSGFGKAMWAFLGCRSGGGAGRGLRQYAREAADGDCRRASEELARLDDLKRRGVISDAEFDSLKKKVVSG